ncbi:alpha-L-glutamate ligase-like protein [Microbulbifer thermotolerans]|uniref:Alpha-L-glutamate ligase-like protein n=1 Tax=Microbulbifer thermotolerans TaxID=252514 RepID=A0A143HMZ2_MICTH|nr:alpha-L-glutamate ligase-like protein [Microbulbifer thermotolerans]AMX03105.1 alpha-L-glutamate ligase-like protein [Microbulbifer thermotolerans]MCX2779073.1 alpha-L-glutamate ligase-like protein [Microbulbifer thermotolerans]MCX2784350.1 alpha-L-glutamate ligase-like protein [Microbulbifer thermotolerans]MCX2796018.1 alpha-L-glutamate ligase-like protein [Microbulbifer thermotolerans]MCX2801907.1 alpha-L-glutamate ligase-like protein [Microbulbifer thermotolerans]
MQGFSAKHLIAKLRGGIVSPLALRRMGVLGMNARNVHYIARYNDRSKYPIVDDKLNTKRAAKRCGIPSPELIAAFETQPSRARVMEVIEPLWQFVIKPARGSGGKGILVITGRNGDQYVKPSGAEVTALDILRHVSNIHSGLYSLGGKPDRVMIEALVDFDPVFDNYSFEGVPDIRVIVFRGFPVMAMLRCSTHDSDGKANLHQGAVGVGIDLATGRSCHAVQRGLRIDKHPDTLMPFDKLEVPGWRDLVRLAASCYEMTGLGYLGCDIVLDRNRGPLLLEANARPGLAIQVANGVGLGKRLRHIEDFDLEQLEKNVDERVDYAMRQFAAGSGW